MSIFLGVNIDHIATLRQARGTRYPSLVEAAKICENSGADSITLITNSKELSILKKMNRKRLKSLLGDKPLKSKELFFVN